MRPRKPTKTLLLRLSRNILKALTLRALHSEARSGEAKLSLILFLTLKDTAFSKTKSQNPTPNLHLQLTKRNQKLSKRKSKNNSSNPNVTNVTYAEIVC